MTSLSFKIHDSAAKSPFSCFGKRKLSVSFLRRINSSRFFINQKSADLLTAVHPPVSLHSFDAFILKRLRRYSHFSQTTVVVLLMFVTLVISIFCGRLRRKRDLNVTLNCFDMLPYKTKPIAALIKARRSIVSPKSE